MFDQSLPNIVGSDRLIGKTNAAKIILAAATLLAAASFVPLAMAQETSIVGSGEGKIVGKQSQGLDPSCVSFSTISGFFAEFNCEGEQGIFGTIDSFTTNGNTFTIHGTEEFSTSTITIKGTCDPENAKIIFTVDDGSFRAVHTGQVTCTV